MKFMRLDSFEKIIDERCLENMQMFAEILKENL